VDKPLCRLCGVKHLGGCPSLLMTHHAPPKKGAAVPKAKVVKRRISAKGHEGVEGFAPGTEVYAVETKPVDPLDPSLQDPFGEDPYGFVDAPGAEVVTTGTDPVEQPVHKPFAVYESKPFVVYEDAVEGVPPVTEPVTKPLTKEPKSVTQEVTVAQGATKGDKAKHCPTCTCQRVYASKADKQRAYRERKKDRSDILTQEQYDKTVKGIFDNVSHAEKQKAYRERKATTKWQQQTPSSKTES